MKYELSVLFNLCLKKMQFRCSMGGSCAFIVVFLCYSCTTAQQNTPKTTRRRNYHTPIFFPSSPGSTRVPPSPFQTALSPPPSLPLFASHSTTIAPFPMTPPPEVEVKTSLSLGPNSTICELYAEQYPSSLVSLCMPKTSCESLDQGSQNYEYRTGPTCYIQESTSWVCCTNFVSCPTDIAFGGRTHPADYHFSSSDRECHHSWPYVRIVNGSRVTYPKYPFMTIIGYHDAVWNRFKVLCGASLVNNQWIITAAHCFITSKRTLKIRLGELDIDSTTDGGDPIDLNIADTVLHPDYDKRNRYIDNDIALVKLDRPVTFSNIIRPVCLPLQPLAFQGGEQVRVMGWGTIGYGDRLSNALHEVDVDIVSREKCIQSYEQIGPAWPYRDGFPNTILCAARNGKDSCQGDSGGPLLYDTINNPKEQQFVLAGVVSQGIACAQEKYPGIYTRVDRYVAWILDTIFNGSANTGF